MAAGAPDRWRTVGRGTWAARGRQRSCRGQARCERPEAGLRRPANLRILAPSIPILPDAPGWEAWINCRADHRRLLGLIGSAGTENLLIISGDTDHEWWQAEVDARYPRRT